MNEDRFDGLLNRIREEEPAGERAAIERVRAKLGFAGPVCAGFRAAFPAYRSGGVDEAQRLLIEDHVSRCVACRTLLHEAEVPVAASHAAPPRRHAPLHWQRWAIAAALAASAVYLGRDPLDAALAPSGPRATVTSVSGHLDRLEGGVLTLGAEIGEGMAVRTGAGSRARLRLRDGSMVEMNERSQLYVNAYWSGQAIHLERGDVMVQAASQRRGRLRVITRDTRASVKGTVFAVSSGAGGSMVSVVEGKVQVEHGGQSRLVQGGEQEGSAAGDGMGVRHAVAWSQDAEKYIALLGELAQLEKQIAAISVVLRTDPKMVAHLPGGALAYAAIPNSPDVSRQTVALLDQRARESAVLRQWWESADGIEIRQLLEQMQSVARFFGDEIVFALMNDPADPNKQLPVVLAEVKGDTRALQEAIDQAMKTSGEVHGYRIASGLFVLADTPAELTRVLAQLGRGATSAFAADIRDRYQAGAGWLLGVDIEALLATAPAQDRSFANAIGAGDARRIFFEQRQIGGVDQNDVTLTFRGSRQGIASWLAAPGAGAASEYISGDAVLAVSASTRNPRQAFDELVSRIGAASPHFLADLREFESKSGLSVSSDIAATLGTDFAFAIETPTLPVPGWVIAVELLQPGAFDGTVRRIVDAYNRQLKPEEQSERIAVTEETVTGQRWLMAKSAAQAAAIHWTHHGGYLIASTDRAVAIRSLAVRNGGAALVRSAAFRQQLPAAAGVHQSGFAWFNTKGALGGLIPQGQATALRSLLESRDPVLIVVNGEMERIRAASRTRLTSLVLDLMLASGTGHAQHTHTNGTTIQGKNLRARH
jgi:hypothetical protein